MRRWMRTSILLLVMVVLAGTTAAMPESRATDLAQGAPLAQGRLVVFEGFLRPG